MEDLEKKLIEAEFQIKKQTDEQASIKKEVEDLSIIISEAIKNIDKTSSFFTSQLQKLQGSSVSHLVGMKKDNENFKSVLEEIQSNLKLQDRKIKDLEKSFGTLNKQVQQWSSKVDLEKKKKDDFDMNIEKLKELESKVAKFEKNINNNQEVQKHQMQQWMTKVESDSAQAEMRKKEEHDKNKDKMKTLEDKVATFEKISLQNQDGQQQNSPTAAVDSWEAHLVEKKKKNVIIFGLKESISNDIHVVGDEHQIGHDTTKGKEQILALFQDIGVQADFEKDIETTYRIGKQLGSNIRPVVIKLASHNIRSEILSKAKHLKGNATWTGVFITEDLTKRQYMEERIKEQQLRTEATRRNQLLSTEEEKIKQWTPIGGRGWRHLILKHLIVENGSINNKKTDNG